MSENNYLDEILKERISDYASETPTHLWQGIAANRSAGHIFLNRLKRKWGIFLLLLLGMGGAAFWLASSTNVIEPSILSSANVLQTDASVAENWVGNTVEETILKPSTTTLLSENTIDIKEDVDERESNIDKQTITTKDISENVVMEDVIDASVTPHNTRMGKSKSIDSGLTMKSSYTPTKANNHYSSNISEHSSTSSSSLSASTMHFVGGIDQWTTETRARDFLWATPVQKIEPQGLAQVDWVGSETSPLQPSMRKLSDYDCNTFGTPKKGKRFALDVIFSPNYVVKSLKEQSPEFAEYRLHREQTETPKFAYTFGVRIHYNLFKGLSVGSGLLYSQFNEVFDYEGDDTRTFITTVVDTTFDSGGNVVSVDIDTISVEQAGTRIVEHHNQYRFIDVPFLLGYTIPGKKVNFTINGGALLNLSFKKRGRLLSPDTLEPMNSELGTSGSSEVYKTQVGLSLYAAVGANYKITDNIHFIMEPWMRYNLKPLTIESHPVEERYMNVGLNTGLRFIF